MKLFTLFLSLCFTLNVLAASGTVTEFERALDDYQYTMTVEWDQQDQVFYQEQSKIFFDKMGALMNDQGLTKEVVLALAERKMGDKKAFEALKLKLSMMGKVASSSELAQVLSESSKEFYRKGASWNGETVGSYLLWGGLALVIAYVIWFEVNYKCVSYTQKWECDTTNYDSGSSTSCGWRNVCTQYEKK